MGCHALALRSAMCMSTAYRSASRHSPGLFSIRVTTMVRQHPIKVSPIPGIASVSQAPGNACICCVTISSSLCHNKAFVAAGHDKSHDHHLLTSTSLSSWLSKSALKPNNAQSINSYLCQEDWQQKVPNLVVDGWNMHCTCRRRPSWDWLSMEALRIHRCLKGSKHPLLGPGWRLNDLAVNI